MLLFNLISLSLLLVILDFCSAHEFTVEGLQNERRVFKVLNWLVTEQNDKDSEQMHSDPKRIRKYVDFVLDNQGLCKVKAGNDITCLELRQFIDASQKLAATQGIKLDEKFTNFGAKLARFFNQRASDVARPYGVSSLLFWVLGLNAGKQQSPIGSMGLLKIPLDTKTAIKFIIEHKDELWAIIKKGLSKTSFWNSNVDIDEMAHYLHENADRMGFHYTEEDEWKSVVQVLKDKHHLFRTTPVGSTRYF